MRTGQAARVVGALLPFIALAGCSALDYTLMAKTHYEAEEYDQAIDSATLATDTDPRYAPAWYWRGMAHLKKKEWDEATRALEKAIELKPSDAQLRSSYKWLGFASIKDGQYDRAIAALTRAVGLYPESERGPIYKFLGFARDKKGEWHEASRAYRQAIALGVDDNETRAFSSWANLMKHLQPAQEARKAGNYRLARAGIRRAIEDNPRQMMPYYEAGALALELCDPDAAIGLLEAGLALVPTSEGLRRRLGIAYGQKGDAARAFQLLGRRGRLGLDIAEAEGAIAVRTVEPGGPAARAGLQPGDRILQLAGRPVEDVENLATRIGQQEPGTPLGIRIQRGGSVFDATVTVGSWLDPYRPAPITEVACRAQELNREGVARARQLKREAALGKFEEALQQGAGLIPKAHYNAALVLEQLGRPRDAIAHYIAAHAEFLQPEESAEAMMRVVTVARGAGIGVPESADRRYRVGVLRATQKRYREAVEEFEAALAEAPWLVEAYYNLGLVHDFLEDHPSALRVLRRYVRLAPTAPNVGSVKSKIVELEDRLGMLTPSAAEGAARRGWLGVAVQELAGDVASASGLPPGAGVLVVSVVDGSPAQEAGLEAGDIIQEVDGRPVRVPSELARLVASREPGTRVSVKLVRDGSERTLLVGIGGSPGQP